MLGRTGHVVSEHERRRRVAAAVADHECQVLASRTLDLGHDLARRVRQHDLCLSHRPRIYSRAMTATLPADVQKVFDRFITTEYTTIDSRGQPITWPVTPYHNRERGTIDITTGLGYPKKARDAQRNPRVSLLFSDPTGSS